jgi:hypothetical protein
MTSREKIKTICTFNVKQHSIVYNFHNIEEEQGSGNIPF